MTYIDIRACFHHIEHGFYFERCLRARTVEEAVVEASEVDHKLVKIYAMQNQLPNTLWVAEAK